MNIIIHSINFKASNNLENYVKQKINKLYKNCTALESATVILRKQENGKLENKSCKIKLAIPGNDPVVTKSTRTYEMSVLQTIEALQKVLRRKKNKLIAKRHTDK